MIFRAKYYALIGVVAVLAGLIVWQLFPLMSALMGAATLYVLLRRQMRYLTQVRHWRRWMAAVCLLAEAVVGFVVPFALVVWLVVGRVAEVAMHPEEVVGAVETFARYVAGRWNYDLWSATNVDALVAGASHVGQWAWGHLSGFLLNISLLPFILYFMLLGGERMENYVRELIPFDRAITRALVDEVRQIIRSTALLIPISALVQGTMAYGGYLSFGVPTPLFWAVVTAFATMIPVAGAALVWLPLALWTGITAGWGLAAGLAVWGVVAINQIDNLVQRIWRRRMTDLHPLTAAFGVFVGVALFGFMGLIFGPLLVALFVLLVDHLKRQIIDRGSQK